MEPQTFISENLDYKGIIFGTNHRIDVSLIKTRAFKSEGYNFFDKIYFIDLNVLKIIKHLDVTTGQRDKVSVILEIEEILHHNYGNESDFEMVFELLNIPYNKINFYFLN